MGVTKVSAVDTKTPWCSACKGYTDFSTEISYAYEGGTLTTHHCKSCNEIMLSAESCKRRALTFNILRLLTLGMCACGMWTVLTVWETGLHAVFMCTTLPILSGVMLLGAYWCGPWRRCAKHLKQFDAWATNQSRNLYADRK